MTLENDLTHNLVNCELGVRLSLIVNGLAKHVHCTRSGQATEPTRPKNQYKDEYFYISSHSSQNYVPRVAQLLQPCHIQLSHQRVGPRHPMAIKRREKDKLVLLFNI